MSDLPRAFYFGCWGDSGHYLHHTDGKIVHADEQHPLDPFRATPWLDGGLAPRCAGRLLAGRFGLTDNALCWAAMGQNAEDRNLITNRSVEWAQGAVLLHRMMPPDVHTPTTLLAWWDRTQGDTRPGSNSVFIVEQDINTYEEMIALWPQRFPRQARNLERAGIRLRKAC